MIERIHYNPDLSCKRWISYFDLLGITNLFKAKNEVSIFIALSHAIEELKKRTTAWDTVGYSWFSDTFIVYADDDSAASFSAIDNISRWFLYFLITGDIPARGAIACDKFYADKVNALFFGEALLEAHEYGEAQDWIGFLLCPSAERELKKLGLPPEKLLNYAYTKIPFKIQASNIKSNLPACIIGNWIAINNRNPIIKQLDQMKQRIIDVNVRFKYERTIAFIETNKRIPASQISHRPIT